MIVSEIWAHLGGQVRRMGPIKVLAAWVHYKRHSSVNAQIRWSNKRNGPDYGTSEFGCITHVHQVMGFKLGLKVMDLKNVVNGYIWWDTFKIRGLTHMISGVQV